LRSAAVFAARQAQEMKVATEKMRAETSEVGHAVDLLDASFSRLDALLTEIESVRRRLESDHPEVKQGYDAAEVEKLFSASYTTEMEREILRAALNGTPLPEGQPSFEGNSVELF
jgi:selenocysteine-specific translation elongation factor